MFYMFVKINVAPAQSNLKFFFPAQQAKMNALFFMGTVRYVYFFCIYRYLIKKPISCVLHWDKLKHNRPLRTVGKHEPQVSVFYNS